MGCEIHRFATDINHKGKIQCSACLVRYYDRENDKLKTQIKDIEVKMHSALAEQKLTENKLIEAKGLLKDCSEEINMHYNKDEHPEEVPSCFWWAVNFVNHEKTTP